MTTTLPVHLTASFILTPDRRHVRFDDYDNLESKYNRWLLSSVAPPLYLYLLEHLLKTQGSNRFFWPGDTNTTDPVTRILVDSFYTMHLARSQRIICTSSFDKTFRLSPCYMVVLGAEPPLITKILSLLPNPRFVRLPPAVRQRCLGYVQMVDRGFLKSELKKYSDTIISLYNDEKIRHYDIQCLLDSLLEGEEEQQLFDLPLLPLADGTLSLLQAQDDATKIHYVWKPHSGQTLFDPSYLIHPDFDVGRILCKGYNIDLLSTPEIVGGLMRNHIVEAPILEGVSQEKMGWILTFWEEYPHFTSKPIVDFFPLIPTTRPGQVVSLNSCSTNPTVLITTVAEEPWLCDCLDKLGASVIKRDGQSLPQSLRDMLQPPLPMFSFTKLLQYIKSIENRISAAFLELDKDMHLKFAEWARPHVAFVTGENIANAKLLPIWPELKPSNQGTTLRRATEVRMLPQLMPSEAVMRFVKVPTVEYWSQLQHLGIVPLSHGQLWDLLDLPEALTNADDQSAYRQLLTRFLADTTFDHKKLLLPSGNGTLVNASRLYSRHSFFVAAFGDAPDNFLLDSYRDMEDTLAPTGLKGQSNLDLDTFITCATSISRDYTARDRRERAVTVFQTYCQDLPLRLEMTPAEDSSAVWRTQGLDSLRFIPRDPVRQKSMRIQEDSPYVEHLPDLVSPKEVLSSEYESIAWTQRALFLVQPHSRIKISNPGLGVPTTREVVKHLSVLALKVAPNHPSNQYLLSDLEATYRWLDDHQDEAEDIIITYHDKPLFLNVDDPKTETWTWHCADEMFFNISDGDLKPVRKFLLPFKDLLAVAGVEEIVNPTVPTGALAVTAQSKLSSLHTGFNLMRIEGKLTDVVFITSDEPEQRFLGHRAILSPMSEYLRDLFCGDFTESGPASADEPVEIELDYSGKAVGCILDHLYTGQPPDLEHLVLSDALDALDLSQYWGLREVNELIQINIIQKNFITPITYEQILQRATELDATLVLEACVFFEEQNRDAIMRLRGEFYGPRSPRRIPKKPPRPLPSNAGKWELQSPKSNRVKRLMHKISSSWSRTRKLSWVGGSN